MPEKNLRIKNRVKEFRLQKGLTQEELAHHVGVRRETIVFLEKGSYSPSLRLALSIATELHIGIEKLFSIE